MERSSMEQVAIVKYLLMLSIFRRKQKIMYHPLSLESTSLKTLLLLDPSLIIGYPCQ